MALEKEAAASKAEVLGDRPTSTWLNWKEHNVEIWNEWVSQRPEVIRDIITSYNLRPDRLYKLKNTGERVTLYSFHEEGTLTVTVREEFNQDSPGRTLVREIDPADIEETEWEGPLQECE